MAANLQPWQPSALATPYMGGARMGGTRRRRVEPTDEWEQLKLLCRWPGRPPPATPGASLDIVPRWSVMPLSDRRFVRFSSSASGCDRSPSGSSACLSRLGIGHWVETRRRWRPHRTGSVGRGRAVSRRGFYVTCFRSAVAYLRTAGARQAGRPGSAPRWGWPAIRPARAPGPGRRFMLCLPRTGAARRRCRTRPPTPRASPRLARCWGRRGRFRRPLATPSARRC